MNEGRRSQEVRSSGTRLALLRATIDCLVKYGYADTTTRLVADRAEVSRGAQTHNFPTKRDLVVASIEHLFDEHAREFAGAFEQVPDEARTLDRAVDALWEIVSGPSYAAVLEVIVAARTDDELRVVVHATASNLQHTVVGLLMWFAPEITDADIARRIVDLAFTVVQGAAVSSYGGFGNPDEVVEFIKAIAGHAPNLLPTRQAQDATDQLLTRTEIRP